MWGHKEHLSLCPACYMIARNIYVARVVGCRWTVPVLKPGWFLQLGVEYVEPAEGSKYKYKVVFKLR